MRRRLQRQPQDCKNDNDGADGILESAVLDAAEFLVRHRHRTGQTHARLIFVLELKLVRDPADFVA